MEIRELDAHRRLAATKFGEVSYVDVGEGPVALFVHGVFMNANLWRKAAGALVDDGRRCIIVDLPAHGRSVSRPDQDLSFPALAEAVAGVCEEAGADRVDLIGNDTGGALCQLFAVAHRERVRTLTLTNCDAHDNFPPEAFDAGRQLAAEGKLAGVMKALAQDPAAARTEAGLGLGYADPAALDDNTLRGLLGPFADEARAREVERFVTCVRGDELLKIDDDLHRLDVPTLIVWGDSDVFFEMKWAYWLRDAIPGAREVVEVPGGRLFFVDEMPGEFMAPLRRFLDKHSPVEVAGSA